MATQDTQNGLGYIIEAINNIVNPKIEKLSYDKTYRAKVVSKLSAGVYTVQIKGAEYQLNYNGDLTVGDVIRVTAPLNNFSDIYVEGSQNSGGGSVSDTLPIGSVVSYGSDIIPANWLLCDGSAISRTTYADLFTIIGTTYGSGDGSTTFNLPNLKGRVGVGLDDGDEDFDALGETGGEKTHTHTQTTNFISSYFTGNGLKYAEGDSMVSNTSTNTGSSSSVQPYIVMNYIIKAKQSAGVLAVVEDTLTSTNVNNALSANQGKILDDRITTLDTKYAETLNSKLVARASVSDKSVSSNFISSSFSTTYLIDTNYIKNNSSSTTTLEVVKDGDYMIFFNVRFPDVTSSINQGAGVSINYGTSDNIDRFIWCENSQRLTISGCAVQTLSAGDTIRMLTYSPSSVTVNAWYTIVRC